MKINIRWDPAELEQLRVIYEAATWAQLRSVFGRSRAAVDQKARSIGLRRSVGRLRRWTSEEVEVLRDLYPTMTAAALGVVFERADTAVFKKAQELGLKKRAPLARERAAPCAWRQIQDDFLIASIGSMSYRDIADHLGYSYQSVVRRAFSLKLSGMNKRKSKPIGYERVYRGKKERKIASTGIRKMDWKRVDVIEWEAKNGPIPNGMLLVKQYGKSRHMENLQLISPADMPLTAVRHNLPPNLRKLLDLKSQIGFALSRIEKKNPDAIEPSSRQSRAWSEAEVAYLRTHHGSQSVQDIAVALGRTKRAVLFRRQTLGLIRKFRVWSDADRARLAANYPIGACVAQMAREFSCSTHAIYAMASKMGLFR